ncbi:hypothetical protein [Thermococcus gammatolerans]|uniref:Uncharacterized protein n=1 Tax=Thermococcus gammatolerans (strain DSM 15229 / JCM 11827 / EJ3) TaxID=593117 RepID=C5A5C2_THEGJ|nr:hypothetical protein [Thermococcus gammatolerans]ACS33434.1 Hypothetical protein TGAM_0932 [Thermococcus gammatolerans EJ3]
MRRSPFVVVILLLMLIPLVAGATLECPSKAPADKVICRLEGNGTGKLYLKSVDGVPAEDYTIIIEHNSRDVVSSSNFHDTFEFPAEVFLWANNALENIVGFYVGSIPSWLLMNKEHTFVFELVMENGSRETFEKKIFLVTNPNWGGLKEDLVDSLRGAFILWIILSVFWGIAEWWRSRDFMRFIEITRLSLSSTALLIVAMFSLFNFRPVTFGIPYYYFGHEDKLWGDIVVWWGIWALTTLVPLYIFTYLRVAPDLRRMTHQELLSELRKQKLTDCSGLAWFIAPLALVSGAIDSKIEILPLISLVVVLAMFTHYILETLLKPEGVLFINLVIAGFLALKYRPDFAFVALLVILLFAVYVIQKKCLKRFTTEKERLIAEIEERVAKI